MSKSRGDAHTRSAQGRFAYHLVSKGWIVLPIGIATLGLGMGIYHWVEGLSWPDAFLNSAMLLGGMGPVDPIRSILGKWLVGSYALFAGIVFLVTAGAILAPVIHHALRRFHLEPGARSSLE